MKLTVVGNRGGRAFVYWPGVIISSFLVAAAAELGAAAFAFATDWYSPIAFILPILMSVGIVVGGSVQRGLRTPLAQLSVARDVTIARRKV